MSIVRLFLALWPTLLLAGCGGPQTRQGYDGPTRPTHEVGTVYPSSAKGALVLITAVDGRNAYAPTWGYAGPVQVLPGVRRFDAQVSIGVDAPAAVPAEMLPPPGVKPVELLVEPTLPLHKLLVEKFRASVTGAVDPGKEYELRYGYTIASGEKRHLLWLEPRRALTRP